MPNFTIMLNLTEEQIDRLQREMSLLSDQESTLDEEWLAIEIIDRILEQVNSIQTKRDCAF
tara:strand:- start:126 stop:308 length:183 start_codon:yes stop_codon:yes gene_type:complete